MTAPAPGDGPGGLRERKKQLRREALHEAALRLLERQGLDGTTVEQICEAVGVSPRTFFNYFPSKAAAALNLPEQVVSAEAAAAFTAARGELVPALCDLITASMPAGAERRRLKDLAARQPELMPAFTRWMVTVKDEFAALVQQRADSPETARAAVALTLSALNLLAHRSAEDDASPFEAPVAEQLREAVDQIVAVRHSVMTGP